MTMKEHAAALREEFSYQEKQQATEQFVAYAEQVRASLEQAQIRLRDLAAGKSILIVDAGLEVPITGIKNSFDTLEYAGWDLLAREFLNKAFGGEIPKNSTDIFRQFFGRDIRLLHHDVRDELNLHEDVAALIVSGSPASVSRSITDPEAGISYAPEVTHNYLFQQIEAFYTLAGQQGIPAMGICYGHQVLSHQAGGMVTRMAKEREGMEHIEPTKYGAEFLSALFVDDNTTPREGTLPVNHLDKVTANQKKSALLLRASEQEEGVVHGLVHINAADPKEFSGNPISDADIVKELANDGRPVSISIQAHPESSIYSPLKHFVQTRDRDSFQGHDTLLAADMLQLFSNFLALHKKFQR